MLVKPDSEIVVRVQLVEFQPGTEEEFSEETGVGVGVTVATVTLYIVEQVVSEGAIHSSVHVELDGYGGAVRVALALGTGIPLTLIEELVIGPVPTILALSVEFGLGRGNNVVTDADPPSDALVLRVGTLVAMVIDPVGVTPVSVVSANEVRLLNVNGGSVLGIGAVSLLADPVTPAVARVAYTVEITVPERNTVTILREPLIRPVGPYEDVELGPGRDVAIESEVITGGGGGGAVPPVGGAVTVPELAMIPVVLKVGNGGMVVASDADPPVPPVPTDGTIPVPVPLEDAVIGTGSDVAAVAVGPPIVLEFAAGNGADGGSDERVNDDVWIVMYPEGPLDRRKVVVPVVVRVVGNMSVGDVIGPVSSLLDVEDDALLLLLVIDDDWVSKVAEGIDDPLPVPGVKVTLGRGNGAVGIEPTDVELVPGNPELARVSEPVDAAVVTLVAQGSVPTLEDIVPPPLRVKLLVPFPAAERDIEGEPEPVPVIVGATVPRVPELKIDSVELGIGKGADVGEVAAETFPEVIDGSIVPAPGTLDVLKLPVPEIEEGNIVVNTVPDPDIPVERITGAVELGSGKGAVKDRDDGPTELPVNNPLNDEDRVKLEFVAVATEGNPVPEIVPPVEPMAGSVEFAGTGKGAEREVLVAEKIVSVKTEPPEVDVIVMKVPGTGGDVAEARLETPVPEIVPLPNPVASTLEIVMLGSGNGAVRVPITLELLNPVLANVALLLFPPVGRGAEGGIPVPSEGVA